MTDEDQRQVWAAYVASEIARQRLYAASSRLLAALQAFIQLSEDERPLYTGLTEARAAIKEATDGA